MAKIESPYAILYYFLLINFWYWTYPAPTVRCPRWNWHFFLHLPDLTPSLGVILPKFQDEPYLAEN